MTSQSSRDLQLSLWRAACRHLDPSEAVSGLAETIRQALPIEAMWIFSLDEGRCVLAASWRADGRASRAFAVRGEPAARLARFAARGGLAAFDARHGGRSLLAPLAAALGEGEAVCGALKRDAVAEGIVAVRLRRHGLDERTSSVLATLLEPLAVALENARRYRELESLKRAAEADGQAALRRLGRQTLDDPIVGSAGGLKAVMERVEIVAGSDLPVLILGETGSGKEVIARSIHERSGRHSGPFLRVNCGAIPAELIDSELFGHERGAFTGASDRRKGWFERADGGTLFLDEVGELSPAAQVRLLRVTQEGTMERVGGQETVRVDCRIVAATHRDLGAMVRERTFREDLWYRLSVFPVFLPPLRDRKQDLPDLAKVFAQRAATRFGLPDVELVAEDFALLEGYDWPGTVRELAAVIDRATLLGKGHRLALAAAMGLAEPPTWRTGSATVPGSTVARAGADADVTLDAAIRAHVERALSRARGRIEGPRGAATALGVNAHTLRSRMRKLGIDWTRFREDGPEPLRTPW